MAKTRIKLNIKWRPPKTMVAFCDESCLSGHRYFVIGAVYAFPKVPGDAVKVVADTEQQLADIKAEYSLNDQLKWTHVPSPGQYRDGYEAILQGFLQFGKWYYRCMVIDTSRYPLKHRIFTANDALIGYLKFYCVFIADGLMKPYADHFFDIRIDRYAFREGNDSSDLERTAELRFLKKAQVGSATYVDYCSVRAVEAKNYNFIQLADLLTGAVAFVWNGGMQKTSARARAKQYFVNLIQEELSIDIGKPTKPWVQGFNIWKFKAKS